ncbi:MAG: VanZ family protein [Rhodocyclaceae bacterium]|nr:VanZ family protein [Rhodocyclaceae bacterium]
MTLPPASPALRRSCLACAAAIVFLLFYLGAKPIAVNLFPEPWDKLAHFIVYGAIAALLAVGSARSRPLLLIAFVSAIGAIDEWHQLYLPGRSADVNDWLMDFAAAIVAVSLIEWLRARGAASAAADARGG